MRTALIINPISGAEGRQAGRARARQAEALLAGRQTEVEILVTERPGHARELAHAALARGASRLVAWGGDGTVNDVAAVAAFRDVTLGIVPSGSGNGLARELGLPREPAAALQVALTGRPRVIDCGELDGRLFVNVAGFGLDARVAHQFAAHGLVRRGFRQYVGIAARELFRFQPAEYLVAAEDLRMTVRPLIVAIANARQYGNGALIAPAARVDDGRLDLVVVEARSPWRTLVHVPALFRGRIDRVPGVTLRQTTRVEVTGATQILYHVDGEPFLGGSRLEARVRPGAITVCV